jgi:hypothetical protein
VKSRAEVPSEIIASKVNWAGYDCVARTLHRGFFGEGGRQAHQFRIYQREGEPGRPHEHPLLKTVAASAIESDGRSDGNGQRRLHVAGVMRLGGHDSSAAMNPKTVIQPLRPEEHRGEQTPNRIAAWERSDHVTAHRHVSCHAANSEGRSR